MKRITTMGALPVILLFLLAAECEQSSSSELPSSEDGEQDDDVTPPTDSASSETESFFEGFDRLDTDRWYIAHGWNNGDWHGCGWSSDNLEVSNGQLTLTINDFPSSDRDYSCAEIHTTKTYGYGLYEARIRAAPGAGTNTAMFTYIGPQAQQPHDEIDFEFLGRSPSQVSTNYWRDGNGNNSQVVSLGLDGTDKFVSYAFDWRPDSIRFYINNQLVRVAGPDNLPRTAQNLFLSLWIGRGGTEEWLGHFTYPGQPVNAQVDWIAYTRPEERCRFPQSVSCRPEFR